MEPSSQHTEAKQAEIRRLSTQLGQLPGRELESELWALGLSARTFAVNSLQLSSAVQAFENTFPNPLFQPGKRHELWEYSFEVVRLFQNAIAAGESFLEHCRTSVRRRYRRQVCFAEFEERYARYIEGSPVRMFVKEIRGFLLHKESITPVVSRSLTDLSDPYDAMCAIELNTEPIRAERARWKDKNPKAVEYLDQLRNTIKIRKLLDEYRAVVQEFGDWLLSRERELNAVILHESRTLHDDLATLLGGVAAEEMRVFGDKVTRESWFR